MPKNPALSPENKDTSIPRPEHPRPQWQRRDWINLNGRWTFTFDFGKSGAERGLASSTGFEREILVPFCPESELSGVGHKDFIECIWYQRQIEAPANWTGRRILLHFGAVDYECEAFVDGKSVGRHFGGSSSFTFDITSAVVAGQTHSLVVQVKDDLRSNLQTGGKQSPRFGSFACFYTRVTGIWQTVWLEAVDARGLHSCSIEPDVDQGRFLLRPRFLFPEKGAGKLRVTLSADGEVIDRAEVRAAGSPWLVLAAGDSPRLWSPADPFLYDLLFEVLDEAGNLIDRVESYSGLRKIHIEGARVFLNNEALYQRLVLDQGFYPDGIWTAPSDEALRRDIELALEAGFNGARLHQKVFEERFHYWADRLGYLTWGESASWGLDVNEPLAARNFLSEWRETVLRDRNHPSIITWTPFNETADRRVPVQHERLHRDAYELTRALDPSRPVNDASGYIHVKTDLWTVHHYEQDAEKLGRILGPAEGVYRRFPDDEPEYEGQPYLVDEFGGIKWVPPGRRPHGEDSWGYGGAPKTEEEFYERLEAMVRVILQNDKLCGYCYTQLTDVEQEENGIYNYDRAVKFDMERIRRIFVRTPSGAGHREKAAGERSEQT